MIGLCREIPPISISMFNVDVEKRREIFGCLSKNAIFNVDLQDINLRNLVTRVACLIQNIYLASKFVYQIT